MAKIYHCTIEVRGYELDSYGHVNHAVYISYLEHARWKMLEEEGIGTNDFARWKRWPVIARLEVDYLKPTFTSDRLEVRTQPIDHGRARIQFEQTILRDDVPVMRGKVTVVVVNEQGRAAPIPDELLRLAGFARGES